MGGEFRAGGAQVDFASRDDGPDRAGSRQPTCVGEWPKRPQCPLGSIEAVWRWAFGEARLRSRVQGRGYSEAEEFGSREQIWPDDVSACGHCHPDALRTGQCQVVLCDNSEAWGLALCAVQYEVREGCQRAFASSGRS